MSIFGATGFFELEMFLENIPIDFKDLDVLNNGSSKFIPKNNKKKEFVGT